MKKILLLLSCIAVPLIGNAALSLKDCVMSADERAGSRALHLRAGVPSSDFLERRGYVISFDHDKQVPRWASWHAVKAYRDAPQRKKNWSKFHQDPVLGNVTDEDYRGWFGTQYNFARGHIVPYAIAGGDRDNDGRYADDEETLAVDDLDDACTVFETNSFANIAPQYHRQFNGSSGLWWRLESKIRDRVDGGADLTIIAGTVFDATKPVMWIGRRSAGKAVAKIGVPHGFFKIILNNETGEKRAYLFDHEADLAAGCALNTKAISACRVDLTSIETLTGLALTERQ